MFKLQCLWLSALLLVTSHLRAVEPSFTPLGDLPGGSKFTASWEVSNNGRVVVGQSDGGNAADTPFPFRWTQDTGIVALGDVRGAATDVSADGMVIVGYRNYQDVGGVPKAFRWTASEGVVELKSLGPTSPTYAHSVSDDGMTVFGNSGKQAVRWAADGSVMEMDVGDLGSYGLVASRDGSIVAGTRVKFPGLSEEAFRWTAADGAVSLGRLPVEADLSESYYVRDMTPDGRVIVGYGDMHHGPKRGFRWTEDEGMVELGFFPIDVSDDGRVMVGGGYLKPIIWTAETGAVELQPLLAGLGLDLTGWRLTSISSMSGDGLAFAGSGIPPSPSMSGAWVATIPEPSTWLLGGTALAATALGMLLRRRAP